MCKFHGMAAVIVAALASDSEAVLIAEYQTAASGSNATLTASATDASIVADVMAAGPGIGTASGSTWNWNQWGNSTTPFTSFETAVSGGDFWTWGFDVSAPMTVVSLTDMELRLDRSGTGPNEGEIRASINGGTEVSLLTFDYGNSDSGVDFTGIDLSTLGPLTTGDSIEFTLAAWGADSGGISTGGTFDLETIDFGGSDPRALRINGVVAAIPEPTAALFGSLLAGGLGLTVRRRG